VANRIFNLQKQTDNHQKRTDDHQKQIETFQKQITCFQKQIATAYPQPGYKFRLVHIISKAFCKAAEA
jgi:hypothetical protein